MWSSVGDKREVRWIWVALDAATRRVVAMVAGDRSEHTARCLRDAPPGDYRAGAVVLSDSRAAYAAELPEARHVARGEGDGMTCRVERLRCTARQRCGRFVREALSSSECDLNSTGSLWHLIHHYNASLP